MCRASATISTPGKAAQQVLHGVEQWCERRDLVALRIDRDLGEDDAGAGVQRGQQMRLTAVGQTGAAQCLAVDGDHGPVAARPGNGERWCAGAEPARQDAADQGIVESGQ
ncbi:hypothetical protein Q0Z83_064010 [Actinoplanes sichuanensis]|nr:hypothetical protein Q0Z83_064010 [Actinoplanes sichuanensis]